MNNDFEINTVERLSTLEAKVENMKKKVESLSNIEKAIVEISMTMKQLKDNFTGLRGEISDTNEKLKLIGKRFEHAEKKSIIDIRDIIKIFFSKYALPSSAIVLIIYELAKNLNII